MSLVIDGERSKQRIPQGKRQLALIKDLNVPAKTVIQDGFLIKVQQDAGLEKIIIKAPMGAVVLCSTPDGIKKAVLDYWVGPVSSVSDLFVVFNADGRIRLMDGETAEVLAAEGWTTMQFRPVQEGDYYLDAAYPWPIALRYSGAPSVMPVGASEVVEVTVADRLFVDLNANGLPDYPYDIYESTKTFYSADGSALGGRKSSVVVNSADNEPKRCFVLPAAQILVARSSTMDWYYDGTQPKHISHFRKDTNSIVPVWLEEVAPPSAGMPEGLRALMLDTLKADIRPLGEYAFLSSAGEETFIQALYFDPLALSIDGTSANTSAWFSANPTEVKWRIFLSVTVGGVTTLTNSSQFFSLLDAGTTHDLATLLAGTPEEALFAWAQAAKVLRFSFNYPAVSLYDPITYVVELPHDGIMFHDENNDVHCWSRFLRGMKINAAGLYADVVQVPPEVAGNEGTRPEISYAGDGLYFCACNDVAKSIRALYYGVPNGPTPWWVKLPDPPTDYTTVYVRPVSVSLTRIFLAGVVRYDGAVGDTPRYHIAFLIGTATESAWRIGAVLPFAVSPQHPSGSGEGADNFAVSLFGEGAAELANYPSQPPATPQSIVVPYSGYNIPADFIGP